MVKAIKCDLCKQLQECERFDAVEFGSYSTDTNDDWEVHKNWNVCRKCKRKINQFINKLKVE